MSILKRREQHDHVNIRPVVPFRQERDYDGSVVYTTQIDRSGYEQRMPDGSVVQTISAVYVAVEPDGDYCVLHYGDRRIRVPFLGQMERDDTAVYAEKMRKVKEAAARGVVPKSARESFLHERYRARIRETAHREFNAGIAEGEARVMNRPLKDRVTESDKHELVELVMEMVLSNPDLRDGYVAMAQMIGDVESLSPGRHHGEI